MAKQLFIKSETLFEIEVNFGTIFFDLADIYVADQIKAMYDAYNLASKVFVASRELSENLSDEVEEGELFSARMLQEVEDIKTFYDTVDTGIEKLFGFGAMDKLFGESRTMSMYDQFYDGITPLLDEAGLKVKEHYKKMEKEHRRKYAAKPQDRKPKAL